MSKTKATNIRPFKKAYKHTDNIPLSKTRKRHTNASMKGNHLHGLYIFIYRDFFFNKHCQIMGVRTSNEYIGQEQEKGVGTIKAFPLKAS